MMIEARGTEVDVVVVNWKGRDYLPRCLSALHASTARITVTVVDNASGDGSTEYMRSEWPEIRLVQLDENRGYAGGANVGLRPGSAPYTFVMNPDLLVEADHLAVLRDRLDADPEIGVAQGKLFRMSRDQFLGGRPPKRADLDSAGQRVGRSRTVVDRGQGRPDGAAFDREASVFSACGAGIFLRRAMLHDLGPEGAWFDPAFFAYKEDIDLSWRARLFGWDVRYVPTAIAHHVRAMPGGDRKAWRRLPAHVRRHSWKNHYLMMIKNDRIVDLLKSLPHVLALEVGRLAFALARDPALLPAYAAVIKHMPQALRQRRRNLSTARRRQIRLYQWFGRDALLIGSQTPRREKQERP